MVLLYTNNFNAQFAPHNYPHTRSDG